MKKIRAAGAALAAGTVALAGSLAVTGTSTAATNYNSLNKIQKRLVSGLLFQELGPQQNASRNVAPQARQASGAELGGYFPDASGNCSLMRGNDVKVNQNCVNLADADLAGRSQAQNETYGAADPNAPNHIIATYNDYRRGDGTCGVTVSRDGGKNWADVTAPDGFTRGLGDFAREYFQAGGDTSIAWDTRHNAYLSCQLFNRGQPTSQDADQSSALVVFRSTHNGGSSFNFPGRYASVLNGTSGTPELLDKQLLAVDNHMSSPYRDRVYVTYTLFAKDGTAYIYAVHSADYGETFSSPVLVSRTSAMCNQTFGVATPNGTCNENQDSQPFTAPDGTLYVVFDNFNNKVSGNENRNQVLIARSTNGGESFTAPTRVGYFNDLPDCATYQNGADPFRACVPEKGSSTNSIFRASNYPIGAVDPTDKNTVVVTYGSYINRHSNPSNGCTPQGFSSSDGINLYRGVKNGACNNDIVLSTSRDAGRSFSGGSLDVRYLPVVTDSGAQGKTDQYWQAADYTKDGTLAVSYMDRQYGNDESTGYSDVTLSGSTDLTSFGSVRATSSSMPPPTQFSGLFNGDYTGIAVTGSKAFPLWPDTRDVEPFLCPSTGTHSSPPQICAMTATNASLANDENIYTQGLTIPTS